MHGVDMHALPALCVHGVHALPALSAPPHSAQAHAMLPRHTHVIGACTPHRRATPNPTPSPSPSPNPNPNPNPNTAQESGAAEAAGAMAMLLEVEAKSDAAARGVAARYEAYAESLRTRAKETEAEL